MSNEPRFPATKRYKYPHFFPRDIPIWERFIDKFGSDFLGFDYDVKVGSGSEPLESFGDKYAEMQRVLSTYRIDAIGFTRSHIFIFEVKPNAGPSAIGQVDNYARLYSRDMHPKLPIIKAIVTDFERPDMKYLTNEHNMHYYVV